VAPPKKLDKMKEVAIIKEMIGWWGGKGAEEKRPQLFGDRRRGG